MDYNGGMKVFSHLVNSAPSRTQSALKNDTEKSRGKISKKPEVESKPPRMNLSADEIRAKVEKALGPKIEESDDTEGRPVAMVDSDSPVTQEKLKKVLSTNAFSFSDREREVLEKILSN